MSAPIDLDPKYTAICSERTVQSTDRGFFQELFNGVRQSCPARWLPETFARQPDRTAQMRCLLKDGGVGPGAQLLAMLENVQPVFKPKDARFSVQRRREGDRLADDGEWERALVLLSQAVVRAPPKAADLQSEGGLHLALALWSRAGVLLELNSGAAALVDLQYSLDCGLPAKQHGAFYLRLARANAMSGDPAKAHICLALGDRLCSDPETRRGLDKLRTEIETLSVDAKPPAETNAPLPSNGPHPHLSGASSLLDVHSTATDAGGHYAIARHPIRTGDILLVEQPLAACLLSDCHGTHCLHCMRALRPPFAVPYGCNGCSAVAFCSPACQRIACSTYHRYECQFGDLLIGSGMSVLCYVALRAITQCGSVEEALRRGRQTIDALCAHGSARPHDDRLRRAVMAAFLLSILQRSGFFGPKKKGSDASKLTADELEVAAVLLGLLEVLQFNAHEIYETRLGPKHRILGSKPAYIGVALYRTGALFNHDCHPAVSRYFVGTSIVLAATRPLKPGEAVAENYGPVFTKRTRQQRQRELQSRYWFRCGCQSCAEDWPVLERMETRTRLKCPTVQCVEVHMCPADVGKQLSCRACGQKISLLQAMEVVRKCEEHYREAAQLMEDQNTVKAIEVFAMAIDLFYTVAVPPHKTTQLAQESLRTCLADQGTVVQWTKPLVGAN